MRTTIIRGSHGSRRAFLRQATGTGAMLGAGLLYHRTAHAADEEEEGENGQPNPIPGGVAPFAPFAIFIHHNPLNPANPLSMLNDPSQITDFNGFVGLTHIRGQGTGTDTKTNAMTTLAYQADMGFSQGEFIGTDGQKHNGTFAFVWLDLYNGPVGPTTQIHDYNVHIDRNDVFWMIRVSDDAVDVDFDHGQASLRVSGLEVYDDHDIANSLTYGLGLPSPPIPPVAPTRAKVSFDVEWSIPTEMTTISNSAQHFKGTFLKIGATIKWSAEQPGFRFDSEAPNPARNLISVLGKEENGAFF